MANEIKEIRRTLQNLLPGGRYSVRVRSFNEFGQYSEWSEALEFVATAPAENATNNLVAPNAPRLEAGVSTIDVIMTYNYPNDGIVEYVLEYSSDNVSWTELIRTSGSIYIYQAATDVEHYFRFSIIDIYGNQSPVSPSNSAHTVTGEALFDLLDIELENLNDILPITETEIADDAISTPKLQANAVLAGKIAANQVLASHIAALNLEVGKYIRSSSFVAGSSGWSIDANGTAEFSNVTVRGSSTFSGALSGASGTFSGSLSAASGTFSGSLSSASGTFTGALSGATGSFTGTVTATQFQTGTSGSRVQINSGSAGIIRFYNSSGNEVGIIYGDSGPDRLIIGDPQLDSYIDFRNFDITHQAQGDINIHANNNITIESDETLQVQGENLIITADISIDTNQPFGGPAGSNGFQFKDRGGDNHISVEWDGTLRFFVDVSQVKTFVIDHPDDPTKHLIHGTLEGPEAGVYYRGKGKTENRLATIELPPYFESLTSIKDRTVQLTAVMPEQVADLAYLAASEVKDGKFTVLSSVNSCEFYWEVKAVRKDCPPLKVEVNKSDVTVHGDGPYTYIR